MTDTQNAEEQKPVSDTKYGYRIVSDTNDKDMTIEVIDEENGGRMDRLRKFLLFADDKKFNFSRAIELLKEGRKVCRQGWNGRGMFVFLKKGYHDFKGEPNNPNMIEGIRHSLFENGAEGTATRLPNLVMRTHKRSNVAWLASQTDMLAIDWEEYVEPEPQGQPKTKG